MFIVAGTYASREVINLNRNWQFSLSNDLRPSSRATVNLPHTWNYDAISTKKEYYRGIGNYMKEITAPAGWSGKKVYIRFYGVNSEANVFVNGKFVGEHKGGYTAFTYDITPFIRTGESNNIWVRVSNAPQLDYMPINGDFNIYGGIYRDVELIVTYPVHISLTDNSSNGIYLKQTEVTDEKAKIDATVKVNGLGSGNYTVAVDVNDSDSDFTLFSNSDKVKLDKGEGLVTIPLEIDSPRLWNGIRDAFRYNFVVRIKDGTTTLDSLTVPMGVRYFSIDPQQGFMLNGKPYPLRGVTHYQDRNGVGSAFRNRQHDEDFDLMLEMGVNAVRMTNYPQDPYFYDLCDRYGMIVWSELPLVGPETILDNGYINKESFKENGKQQLAEMISQRFNNTSVFFWGLFSNLTTRGSDDPVGYIKELNQLAHELDPTRPTIGSSNQDGGINFVTDLIGWSQYLGWQKGQVADVDIWLGQLTKGWSQLKSAIGEYGAGGSILHQEDSLQRPNPSRNWHPERWQTNYHEQFYSILKKYPMIWGSFINTMFDFGSVNYRGGDTPGVSDFGLVTYDRREKKDAFYFYKANWNKNQPFVYITERRWDERTSPVQTIKVFSNQDEVELIVNGESHGQILGKNGVFTWENIRLSDGVNIIEAYSGRVRDEADITINREQIIQ